MPSFKVLGLSATLLGLLIMRMPLMMRTVPFDPKDQRPWVSDGPINLLATPTGKTNKTDLFTTGATHLCHIHNVVLRGFNSIAHQAHHLEEWDKPSFAGYCRAWYKLAKTHHEEQEKTLFKQLEALLDDDKIFTESYKEHKSFMDDLNKLGKYLGSLKSPYDLQAKDLLQFMADFQYHFQDHLENEVNTIAVLASHPNAPKEGTPEEAKARALFKSWVRNSVLKAGLTDVAPVFLLNVDRTYENGTWASWPPIPAPIKWTVVNLFGALHSKRWKFASSDAFQNPRELYALTYSEMYTKPKEDAPMPPVHPGYSK